MIFLPASRPELYNPNSFWPAPHSSRIFHEVSWIRHPPFIPTSSQPIILSQCLITKKYAQFPQPLLQPTIFVPTFLRLYLSTPLPSYFPAFLFSYLPTFLSSYLPVLPHLYSLFVHFSLLNAHGFTPHTSHLTPHSSSSIKTWLTIVAGIRRQL